MNKFAFFAFAAFFAAVSGCGSTEAAAGAGSGAQTGTDPVQEIIDWSGRNQGIIQIPDWLKQLGQNDYVAFCKQFSLPQNTVVRFKMFSDKDLKTAEKKAEEDLVQSLMFELDGILDPYFGPMVPENNFSEDLRVEKTNSFLWKGKFVQNYKTGEIIIPSPSDFVLKISRRFTKTADFWQLVETSNGTNKIREYIYYSCWTIPAKTWWQIQASYVNEVVKGIDDRNLKEALAKWFLQNYPEP